MANEKKDFWEIFFNWIPWVIAGSFFAVAIVTAIIYPVYSLGWKMFWMALGTAIFILISIIIFPSLENAIWKIRSFGHYSEEITPILLAFFFGLGVLLFSWLNLGELGSYAVAYDSEGRAKIISGSYFAIPYGKEFVHITSSRNHTADIAPDVQEGEKREISWTVEFYMELVLPKEHAFEKFFVEYNSVEEWEKAVITVAERGAKEVLAKEMPFREDEWKDLVLPEETTEKLEDLGYKAQMEIKDIVVKKED